MNKVKYEVENHKNSSSGQGMELSPDEYHTFAVYWDENGYTYYVDGKEDGHNPSPVSKVPQFILLSTEVNGYRVGATASVEARLAVGDTFVVDYVRVFDATEE